MSNVLCDFLILPIPCCKVGVEYRTFLSGYLHYSKHTSLSILASSNIGKLYYHYLQDPLFHQNAFAIITAVVLFRSMYVMEVNIRPSLRKRWATIPLKRLPDPEEEQVAREVRDKKIVKEMWFMVGMGMSIFLGGFAIWNLDNQFCPTIRVWRQKIGLPWGILLEGHGWW